MANLPATIGKWNAQALKSLMGGVHPKNVNPPTWKIDDYVLALNSALDSYTDRKRKEDRFAAVTPPSLEELLAGISESSKKAIAEALKDSLAVCAFWGGTAMPCPLAGKPQKSSALYVYFTGYARQPALVGLTGVKGVSEFPDAYTGADKEDPGA